MTTHTADEPLPDDDIPEAPVPGEAEPDEIEPDGVGAGTHRAGAGTDRAGAEDSTARTDTSADADANTPGGGEAKPAPFYSRVEDFVDGHFVPLICRPLGGEFRWCAQWWRHAEAISRLTAVWHAWEALRLQTGTGIGIWYRDHLDHQLPMLLGARGPFFQCSPEEHIEPGRLRTEPAPPGWWT